MKIITCLIGALILRPTLAFAASSNCQFTNPFGESKVCYLGNGAFMGLSMMLQGSSGEVDYAWGSLPSGFYGDPDACGHARAQAIQNAMLACQSQFPQANCALSAEPLVGSDDNLHCQATARVQAFH